MMAPRDTSTGLVLEQMILPSLRHGGYTYKTQVNIGQRLGGGRHVVDVLAEDKAGQKIIISLKWQQVSGTAEQKVPFESMCLAETILAGDNDYQKAYLVLGGAGWKLRDFYTGGGLDRHLRYSNLVDIVTLEGFIAKANQGQL
jgi:hypothetical protein